MQDTWGGNLARVVLTWGMRGRGENWFCCAGFQFGIPEWMHGAIEDDDCTVSVDTHHEFCELQCVDVRLWITSWTWHLFGVEVAFAVMYVFFGDFCRIGQSIIQFHQVSAVQGGVWCYVSCLLTTTWGRKCSVHWNRFDRCVLLSVWAQHSWWQQLTCFVVVETVSIGSGLTRSRNENVNETIWTETIHHPAKDRQASHAEFVVSLHRHIEMS